MGPCSISKRKEGVSILLALASLAFCLQKNNKKKKKKEDRCRNLGGPQISGAPASWLHDITSPRFDQYVHCNNQQTCRLKKNNLLLTNKSRNNPGDSLPSSGTEIGCTLLQSCHTGRSTNKHAGWQLGHMLKSDWLQVS